MTMEEKINLCKIFNRSDIDCFNYVKSFCNEEQKLIVERLIELNIKTNIGFGKTQASYEEECEYFQKREDLMYSFGIDVIDGDGYFEGKFYL